MSETTTQITDETNQDVGAGVLIACLEAAGFSKYQTDGDRIRFLQEGGTLEAVINEKLPTYVFMYEPGGADEDRWLLEISRDSKQFDLMIQEFEEGVRIAEEDAAADMELDLDEEADDTEVVQFMDLDEEEVMELANILYGNRGSIEAGLEALCLDAQLYDIDEILEQLWDQEHLTECASCTYWCLEDELDDNYHCGHCR